MHQENRIMAKDTMAGRQKVHTIYYRVDECILQSSTIHLSKHSMHFQEAVVVVW